MGILVRAKGFGFYGNQRRTVGEEFEINSEAELGSWMERLTPVVPAIDISPEGSTTTDDATAPGGDTSDTVSEDISDLREVANRLTVGAAEARAALKQNSPKAVKKAVEELEAEAMAAVAAADAEDEEDLI